MAQEIGLRELIHQVKRELLSQSAKDPIPLFYVEGVDLEIGVVARREGQAGVKLYVVDIGAGAGRERAQTVRVSLRPLYSREEMRRIIEKDPVLAAKLPQAAKEGVLKGDLFEE